MQRTTHTHQCSPWFAHCSWGCCTLLAMLPSKSTTALPQAQHGSASSSVSCICCFGAHGCMPCLSAACCDFGACSRLLGSAAAAACEGIAVGSSAAAVAGKDWLLLQCPTENGCQPCRINEQLGAAWRTCALCAQQAGWCRGGVRPSRSVRAGCCLRAAQRAWVRGHLQSQVRAPCSSLAAAPALARALLLLQL